jgi:flagellar protein FlbB
VAKYGIVGTGPRLFLLVLTVLALIFGGFLWFDFLGIIDVKDTLAPVLGLVGIKTRTPLEAPLAPDLLEQQRIDAQWEALEIRRDELDTLAEELELSRAEVEQMMSTVTERESALTEREKSFNERVNRYDNRNANMRTVSQQFVSMPPEQATERLLEMSDQDVIDILRMTDSVAAEAGVNSVSSYWLQLMPADRSATIQRKMLEKPTG